MPEPSINPLPFLEALAYWSDKIQIGPKAFAALSDQAKVLVFGVARIAKGDELNTVYQLIGNIASKGWTLDEVKEGAADIFERRGWTGKNAYKADAIIRTNIRSAYMAGRYQQLMAMRDTHPYWMYTGIRDGLERPAHHAMFNRVWRWDHPVWDTWFPLNDMNCRCDVIALTPEQAAARGYTIETEDPTGEQIPLYDEDGALVDTVILQPGKGWQLNQAKVYTEAFGTFAQRKVASYPDLLGQLVLADLLTNEDMAILLSGEQNAQDEF